MNHFHFHAHPIEFNEWKLAYEKRTFSWFVKSSGNKVSNGKKLAYYYCNRSGFFKSESKGERSLKNSGSSKIDSHCTAGIQLKTCNDGKIAAKVYHTHYDHFAELCHLRIPIDVRLKVAHQLSEGISLNKVLDKIKETLTSWEDRERVHLLTKKDLSNIENSYQLRDDRRHKDDTVSVRILLQELSTTDQNPILLYKPQAQFESIIGQSDGLGYDDFILVFAIIIPGRNDA